MSDSTQLHYKVGAPLIIDGQFTLTDAEGNNLAPDKTKVAICRCGHSTNQPFCNGAHAQNQFDK